MSILDLKNKIARKWKESKERVEELEKQKAELIEQKIGLSTKLDSVTEEIIKIQAAFSFLEDLVDDNEPQVEKGEESDNKPYFGGS